MALEDYLNSLNDYELESEIPETTEPTDPVNGKKEPSNVVSPRDLFRSNVAMEGEIGAKTLPSPVEPVGQYLPEDFGKYKQDYNVTLPEQLDDLSEFRGVTQSTADKWGNGLLKFAGKTLTNVVGGLGNVLYGGTLVAKTGELNQFYNNEFAESIDDINAAMDENLPNHYTRLEREKSVRDQLGTANFWADKAMNGLSFVAGAALTELAAVGAGALVGNVAGAAALGTANALRITAQATRLLKGASALNRSGKIGQTLRYARYISRKGRLKETATVGRQLLTGASYEAGVEARHAYDTIYDNLVTNLIGDKIAETEEALGRPLTSEERDNLLTVEQRQNLDSKATTLSNGVFVTNFALVGGSNLLMLPKLYGIGSRRGINNLAASGTPNIPKTSTLLDKAVSRIGLGKKTADFARVGQKVVGRGLYEGFVEEGGQGLLQRAASDYALVSQVGDSEDLEVNFRLAIDSAVEGGIQSYTSTEGLTEVMLGAILGTVGLPGSSTLGQSIKEVKSRRAQVDELTKMMEKYPSLNRSLEANAYFFQNVQNRSGALDAAYEVGNMAKIKDLEHDNFFDFTMSKILTGQFADIAEQADGIQNLTDEQFLEMGNYTSEDLPTPEAIQKRKSEVVKAVKERSEKILKATEQVDSTVRMSAADKLLGYATPGTPAYVRMQLIHSLSVIDNVERREKDLTEKLSNLTGGQVISDAKKTSEVSKIKYTDSEGNSRVVNIGGFAESATVSDIKEELAQALYALENLEEVPENVREEVSQMDPGALRDNLNYLESIEDKLGADTTLTTEEYLQILEPARQLEAWKENNPEDAAVHEQEIIDTLIDLRYLRARRQEAALMYRNLLDPTRRQEVIQRIKEEKNVIDEVKSELNKVKTESTTEENAEEKARKEAARQIEQLRIKLKMSPSASPADLQGIENSIVEIQEKISEKVKEIADNSVEDKSRYRTQNVFTSVKDIRAIIDQSTKAMNSASEWMTNADKDIENLKNIIASIDELETQIPNQTAIDTDFQKELADNKIDAISNADSLLGEKMSVLKESKDLLTSTVDDFISSSELDWNTKDPRWGDEEITFSKDSITKFLELNESTLPENAEQFYTSATKPLEEVYNVDVNEGLEDIEDIEDITPFLGDENTPVSPEEADGQSTKPIAAEGLRPDLATVGFWHTAGRQTTFKGRKGAEETYADLKDVQRDEKEEKEFKLAESQLDFFHFVHSSDTSLDKYSVAAVSKRSLNSLPTGVVDALRDQFFEEGTEEDIKLVVVDNTTGNFVINEHGRFIYTSAMDPFVGNRFTNDTLNEEEVEAKEEEFRDWRESVINSPEVSIYTVVGKSNGSLFPKLEEVPVQNIGRVAEKFEDYKNTKLDIATSQKGVEDTTSLDIGNLTVVTYPGLVTAYDAKGEMAIPMVGRPLSSKEVINISRMMNLLLEERQRAYDLNPESPTSKKDAWDIAKKLTINVGGKDINVYNTLEDMVYTSREGKYRLYFDVIKEKYIFGNNESPMALEDFDNPEAVEALHKSLSIKYHNINKSTLDSAVDEVMVTNEDGDLVRSFNYEARSGQEWGEIVLNKDLSVSEDSRLWSNYNEYLLTDREDGESPLRTRVRPISSDKNMLAFRSEGGYLEFDNKSKRPLEGEEEVISEVVIEDIENISNSTDEKSATEILMDYSEKVEQEFSGNSLEIVIEREGKKGISEQQVVKALIAASSKKYPLGTVLQSVKAWNAKIVSDSNQTPGEQNRIKSYLNALNSEALREEDFLMFTSLELPSNKYIQETYAEELKRAQGMTPATIRDVTKFVSLIDGTLLGKLNRDGEILVTELAPGGTAYHEAFHSVSLRLLSQEDSDNLYRSVRNIQGESIPYQEIVKAEDDRSYTAKAKPFSEFTDVEAEEWLAEEFRRYVLSKGKYVIGQDTITKDTRSIFKKVFDRIRDVLRSIFKLDKSFNPDPNISGIEQLFASITKGDFKLSEVNMERDLDVEAGMLGTAVLNEQAPAHIEDMMSSITAYFVGALQTDENFTFDDFLKASFSSNVSELSDVIKRAYFNAFSAMQRDYQALIAAAPEGSSEAVNAKTMSQYLFSPTERGKERRRKLLAVHGSYMEQLGISFELEDSRDESDITEKSWSDNEKNFEVSPINSSSKSVKLLLGTLVDNTKVNSTGLRGVYPLSSVLRSMQNELEGTMKYKDQLRKMSKLTSKYPWMQQVLDRLNSKTNPKTFSYEDIKLIVDFEGQFNKNKFDVLESIISETGKIYTLDPAYSRRLTGIDAKWTSNLRRKIVSEPHVVLTEEGEILIDSNTKAPFRNTKKTIEKIRKGIKGDINYNLDALEHIGIEFSDRDEVIAKKDVIIKGSNISLGQALSGAAKFIYSELAENDLSTTALFARDESDTVTRLNLLREVEIQTAPKNYDLQYLTPNNKVAYSLSLNNLLSTIANYPYEDIAQYYENNPFATNSLALKAMKEGKKIKLGLITGLRTDQQGDTGIKTSDLNPTDLMVVYVDQLIKGIMPMTRAADQSTEFGINFPIDISRYNTIDSGFDVLKGYLEDEIMSANKGILEGKDIKVFNKKTEDLRLTKRFIDNASLEVKNKIQDLIKREGLKDVEVKQFIEESSAEIYKGIEATIKDTMSKTKDLMHRKNLIKITPEGVSLIGIDRSYFKSKGEDMLPDQVSTEEFDKFLEDLTMRQIIYTNEIFKTFLFDPAFYSDMFKRIKGATGTKEVFTVSDIVNDYLNFGPNSRKAFDGKDANGFDKMVVVEEPTRVTPLLEEYAQYSEQYADAVEKADGTILTSLPAYREMAIRGKAWTSDQDAVYNQIMKGQMVTSDLTYGTFPPLKLQYFGPLANKAIATQVPGFFKMSVAPIYPQIGKMGDKTFPGIENMYNLMKDGQLGGIILPSAFKVGVPLTRLSLMEDFEGQQKVRETEDLVENLKQLPGAEVTIDYRFMGKQLEVPSKFKSNVSIGTQAQALAEVDIYEDGKLQIKSLGPVSKRFNEVRNALNKKAFNQLLNELNLIYNEEEDQFTVKNNNYSKLLEAVKRESIRRDIPKSLIDSIEYLEQLNEEDKFVYFDLVSNKLRLQRVLYGLATSRVIRQRFKGDNYVQQSSLGFEVSQDPTEYGLNELESYKEGKSPFMEVYLPHYFSQFADKELVVTEEGIIDESTGEVIGNSDLLDIIGIRIPTDGIHSIEALKVKGFLPRAAGATIVVPSELVTKSGSDFDIDKLIVYLPSYKVLDGQLVKDKFYPTIESWHKNYLEKGITTKEELEQLDKQDLADALAKNFVERIGKKSLAEWKKDNPDVTIYDLNTKGALQNQYMDDMRKLITDPSRRSEYMKPVGVDQVAESKAAIEALYKERGNESLVDLSTVSDYYDATGIPNLMLVHDAFFKGKKVVGISALASTHHSKSQKAGLELDMDNRFKLPYRVGKTVLNKAGQPKYIDFRVNFEGLADKETLSLAGIDDLRGNKISDNLSQLTNASVDIVKNPLLHYLNIDPSNANMWTFLVRLGVPIRTISMFANQPIIKDYMEALEIDKSKTAKAIGTSKKYRSEIADNIRSKYSSFEGAPVTYSEEDLAEMVAVDVEIMTDADKSLQLQILDDMFLYMKLGDDLGNIVTAQSFDTKVFNDRNQLKVVMKMYEDAISTDAFKNVEKISEGPDTFMKSMTQFNSDLTTLFDSLYITENLDEVYQEGFKKVFDTFTNPDLPLSLDERARVLTKYENGFISFLLQNITPTDGPKLGSQAYNLMFGDNSVAKQIAEIQAPQNDSPLRDNKFIQSLIPVIASKKDGEVVKNDYLQPVNRSMTTLEMNELHDEFKKLMGDNEVLAKDLIKAAYLQSGLNATRYSFLNTIPGDDLMILFKEPLDQYAERYDVIENLSSKYYEEFFKQESSVNNATVVPYKSKFAEKNYEFTFLYTQESSVAYEKAKKEGLPLPKRDKVLYRGNTAIEKIGSNTFENYTFINRTPSNTEIGEDTNQQQVANRDQSTILPDKNCRQQ